MSQCEQVLNFIKTNGSIEPMQALNQLGIYRLASRISDLRQAGNRIETTINKNGQHHYAVYTLEK